jgi:hypothetical protein
MLLIDKLRAKLILNKSFSKLKLLLSLVIQSYTWLLS